MNLLRIFLISLLPIYNYFAYESRAERSEGRAMAPSKKGKNCHSRALSSGSISMTSGWEKRVAGTRVVAEFQSGAANQVINHSGGKGPSKNRLM